MHARPNFFIIGAPKCGTTALADWLQMHPEACISIPKEPHFFREGRVDDPAALAGYERCFAHAEPQHRAIGDASTTVVFFDAAFERIRAYQPEARYILMLRNPVDMAVSVHNQLINNGDSTIRDFETAWHTDVDPGDRTAGGELRHGARIRRACNLVAVVERTFRYVPRERLLILFLEDLQNDPVRQLERVADFLGIARGHEALFGPSNVAVRIRSIPIQVAIKWLVRLKRWFGISASFGVLPAIARINRAEGEGSSSVSPAMRTELKAYFRADIARLGALLGRDLSHWTA
jgi:hypothetical protein